MTNKAVSKEYKCNPSKISKDKNPYIQVDIDRFIGYLKEEVKRLNEALENTEGTVLEESLRIRILFEEQKDSYEGLLGMIEANSFK